MKNILKNITVILLLFVFLSTNTFASTAQTIVWDANDKYSVNLGVGVFNNTVYSGGVLKMPYDPSDDPTQWVTLGGADYVVNSAGQYYFRASNGTAWYLRNSGIRDVAMPVNGNVAYVLRQDGTVYRDSDGITISGISNASTIFAVRDSVSVDHIYYLTKNKRIRKCAVYYTGSSCSETTISGLPEKDFIKLSGSNSHFLAIAADGTVYGWRHSLTRSDVSTSTYLGSSCNTTSPDVACLVRSGVTDVGAACYTSYMVEGGKVYGITAGLAECGPAGISSFGGSATGYVKTQTGVELTNVAKIGTRVNLAGGIAVTTSGELYFWGNYQPGYSGQVAITFAQLMRTGIPSNFKITKPAASYYINNGSFSRYFNPPLVVIGNGSTAYQAIGETISLPSDTPKGSAIYELNYTSGTIFSSVIPSGNGTRYAFSTDGSTWKIWNGSSWVNLTNFDAIYTSGMTTIGSIGASQWKLLQSGTTKIFMAIAFTDFSQSVSSITITKARPIEVSLGCPLYSLNAGSQFYCSANIYVDTSVITTGTSSQWSISQGTVVSGGATSATLIAKLIGTTQKTESVTLKVCGNSPNTSICDTKTVNITVSPPYQNLSGSTLTCPSTSYTGKSDKCTAKAFSYNGEYLYTVWFPVVYTWSSLSSGFTVTPDNATNKTAEDKATVTATTTGTKQVRVKIAWEYAPDIFTEKAASIEYTSPPVKVTSLNCEQSSAYLGQQVSCSAVVDNPGGYSLTNTWTISNVDNSTGGIVVSTGGTELTPTATVKPTTTQQAKIVRLRSCASTDPSNCGEKAFTINVLQNNIDAVIIGDEKLLYNEEGYVHLSSVTKNWGTLQYSWSVSTGGTKTDIPPVSPNVSSVKVKSTTSPLVVTARISLQEDPTFFVTKTHNIEVVVPELEILSFSCPPEIDYSQTSQTNCSINVHAQSTTDRAIFTWTGNGVSFTGQTDTDKSSQVTANFQVGSLNAFITVKACLFDAPSICKTKSVNTKINYPPPVIGDLNCPSSLYIKTAGECSASISNSWGTAKNKWTLLGGTITPINDNTISVFFDSPPLNNKGVVTIQSCLNEVPSICSSKTKEISIVIPVITISSMECPSSLYKRTQGECNVVASVTDNLPLSYTWRTNTDGVINASNNTASIRYEQAGTKSVFVDVVISSIPSIKVTQSKVIEVTGIKSPVLEVIGSRTVNVGQPFTLSGRGTSPHGNVRLSWDVGRVEVEGDTLNHYFLEAGLRYITLKGIIEGYEDDPDAEAKLTVRMTVNGVRKPYFLSLIGVPAKGVVKAEVGVPFTIEAVTAGDFPRVVTWHLPDGTKVKGNVLTYTPQSAGEMKIKATVEYEGFVDPSLISSVEIGVLARVYELITPELKLFTPLSGVAPYYIAGIPRGNFLDLLSFKDNSLRFQWDFGDGTVKETIKPSVVDHIYVNPGVYTVSLTLFDARGNQKTVSETIEVSEPPPLVIDSFRIVKSNKFSREPLVVFLKPKILGGHPKADKITEFKWSLNGQPLEGSLRSRAITLSQAGIYTISLDVVSAAGRTASNSVTIEVVPNKPAVCDFTYVNYRTVKATKFTSSCIDPDGNVRSYYWELGNGETSIRANPYVQYSSPGEYRVRLTATDTSGAETVVEKVVVVDY